MKVFSHLSLGIMMMLNASLAWSAHYEIDASHSTIGFAIKHMVVSKTRGKFEKFSGSFDFDKDKPASWKTQSTVDVASVNTSDKKRDDHLRSPDFFDAQKYPTMTFKSLKVTDVKGSSAKLHGDLTIHGVTKPVVFDLEIGGLVTDPWGNKRAGFSAKTKIARKDFGLTWNKVLDTGGLAVGDEVEIELEVEGIQK